jgi:iron(III) transport system substrate-binding protein
MHERKVAGVATLIAMAALLSACGGSSSSADTDGFGSATSTSKQDMSALVAAAKKEGHLTFYGVAAEDKMEQWVAPFEKQYGIKVKIYRGTASEVQQRFSQESQAGRGIADVVDTSVPDAITSDLKSGWVAKYTPQSASAFPSKLVTGDAAYPMYADVAAIAWNTDKVSPSLAAKIRSEGYQALLDSSVKGPVGIVSPAAGGMQLAENMAIVNDPHLGWNFFTKLKAAGGAVFNTSVSFVADQLTTGEYPIGIGIPDAVVAPAIASGAPLEFAFPPNTPASLQRFFISAKAPDPAAARLFLEWGTGLQAQSSLAQISGGMVARTDWKDTRSIHSQPWYVAPANGLDTAWETASTAGQQQSFTQEWLDKVGH